MEFLVLLLLLALAGDSRDYGRTLKELLAFYRENREIISLFAKNFAKAPAAETPAAETPAADAPAAEAQKERDRPQETDDLIRQFLERKVH